MKYMDDLKEKLCKELEEVSKKKSVSMQDLDMIHKLTDTVKNIGKIEMQNEGSYSHGKYMNDNSYRARYSMSNDRDYSNDYSNNGYSNGNGSWVAQGDYSHGSDDRYMMNQKIEEMITDGRLSADERRALRKAQEIMNR